MGHWGSQPLAIQARAAVRHFAQELGLEPRRNPEAINPPFRTPLEMWFKERIAVESLANEVLYGRLAQDLTDVETLDMTLELHEIQSLPVPTLQPLAKVFLRLLNEADGLFSPREARHGVPSKIGGFIAAHAISGTNLRPGLLSDSSSTLQEYFCGPDAGLSIRLYDRYIRLANVVSKAKWETPVVVVDLHEAAKHMLKKLPLRNQHILSMEISDFLSYFQKQVKDMEELVDFELSRMLDLDSSGEEDLLKRAKAIFAHITALKQAYQHELRPPLWSSAAPQRYGLDPKTKRRKRSVEFSESATTIIVAVPKRETELTSSKDDDVYDELFEETPGSGKQNILRDLPSPQSLNEVHSPKMPLDSIAAKSSPFLVSPRSPKPTPPPLGLEQADVEVEEGNYDSQDVEGRMQDRASLFDTRSGDPESHGAHVAKLWFKSFTDRTQILLKARRGQADERVRIALLDTGIDLDHPGIAKSKARILGCRSWVAGDSSMSDTCGHGTHIASVILRMAPWAHLYVARVFRNEDEVDKAGAAVVAKAINHARSEWKVDILSISFGYRTYMLEIEAAIKACVEAKPPILIFAAAANTGAREDRPAFPASMGSVFCIYSASGDGIPSAFNPPMRHGNDNFSFIGEAISGAWPVALDRSGAVSSAPEKTLSGTSLSAPVAASVAALVLEFCRQRPPVLNESCVARIHTYDGMREVFRETMAGKEDRRDMLIQPWRLLDARLRDDLEEARHVAASTLASAMKTAFGL
jgi:Subtilase family